MENWLLISFVFKKVYFKNAEAEDMPRMLIGVKWEEVKTFFEREVKKIAIGHLK